MGHRRQLSSPPLPAPASQPARHPKARLWPYILPVLVMGGLAMLHVIALARLSELEYECRRLERLSLEQDMRRHDLLRVRQQLVDHAALSQYAQQRKLVAAGEARPLQLGPLPTRSVYWALPGEQTPPRDGAMLGWTASSPNGRRLD